LIEVEDLSKQFDQFWAVDGINLCVPEGQVLALLGPNGAGKTTTVRMLTSILTPTRGWAKVAGYDVVRQADGVRASVGVLTEHHGLYARMTATEYLLFYGRLYSLSDAQIADRSARLLADFDLTDARSLRLGKYSKGMRQKLSLVRALIHDPPVLLLDEPTSAMDPESARTVRDAIQGLKNNRRTVVLCTHNLSEAEELADQIAIIRKGRIILQGSPREIKRRLLGAPVYELHLQQPLNGSPLSLPAGVRLIEAAGEIVRVEVDDPERDNPELLRRMVQAGFGVVRLQEVTRSLEDAYLEAVQRIAREENHAA
jgi:ABC-2 type transport system ATP-binding protein